MSEGMCDWATCVWHLMFGFPGALNDINVWDQSTLLRSFLDGSCVEGIDFPCQIGNEAFDELFISVDGIHADLSQFVKTHFVPLTAKEMKFAAWQESMRKAIKQAFGIFQRKFQTLCRPVELWFEDEITNVVETCFMFHNMMVEVHLNGEEEKQIGWCHSLEEDEDEDEADSLIWCHAVDLEEHGLAAEKPTLKQRIKTVVSVWPLPISELE